MTVQPFPRVWQVIAAERARVAQPQEITLPFVIYIWVTGLLSLALVCLFWPFPWLLLVLLSLDAGLMLSARKNVADLILIAFCGALGAVAEAFGIGSGAWSYALPMAMGVPIWLPTIWGIAALFIKEIGVQIEWLVRAIEGGQRTADGRP